MSLLAAAAALLLAPAGAATAPRVAGTLAVIDFENVNKDKALDWLGTGIAETLTTQLSRMREITVVERSRLHAALKEIKFARSEFVDPATAAKVGRIVGASSIVLGSYQKFEDQVRLVARMVEVETGRVLAPTRVDGSYRQIFELQDALATSLAKEIKGTLAADEAASLEQARPSGVDAFQLFSDGVYFLRNDLVDDALTQFDQALVRDPAYGEAHFYRGLALSRLKRWDEAAAALKRALPRSRPERRIRWTWDVPYEGDPDKRGMITLLDEKMLEWAEAFRTEGSLKASDQVVYTERVGNTTVLHVADLRQRTARRLVVPAEVALSQIGFGSGRLLALQGEVSPYAAPPYPLPFYLVSPAEERLVAQGQVQVTSFAARPFPIVRGDVLYMDFAGAGVLRAHEASNGRVRWERKDLALREAWSFVRSPRLGDLALVKSADGRTLHAIRTTDGADAWSAELPARETFVYPREGRVVSLPAGHAVSVYDLDTGRVQAEVAVPPAFVRLELGPGFALRVVPALLGGDSLYFLGEDEALHAVSLAEQGRLRWQAPLGRVQSLDRNGARLYVGTQNGKLAILDAASGRIEASPQIARKDLVVEHVDDALVLARSGSTVYALDPATGAIRWQHAGKAPLPEPQFFKGLVILRSDRRQLSVLDAATGAVLWQYVGKQVPAVHTTPESLFVAEEAGVREYAVEGKPGPGLSDKEVFTELAAVHLEQGNLDEAARILEKVTREIDPDYPRARLLRSRLLRARQDPHAGRELAVYLSLLDPGSPQAREAFDELKRDHGLLWRVRLEGRVPSRPRRAGDRIVTTGNVGAGRQQSELRVAAVERETGRLAWQHPGRRFLAAEALPDGGAVYATGDAEDARRVALFAVDPSGARRELAGFAAPGDVLGGDVAVSEGRVLLAVHALDVAAVRARIVVGAYDAVKGTRLWERRYEYESLVSPDRAPAPSGVRAAGGYVAFVVEKEVVVLRGLDGEEHARQPEEAGVHPPLSLPGDGRLYYATEDGRVVAYDLASKTAALRLKVGGTEADEHVSASAVRDGILYESDARKAFALDLRPPTPAGQRLRWRVSAAPVRFGRFFFAGERLVLEREDGVALDLDPATGAVLREPILLWDDDGLLIEGDTAYALDREGVAYAQRLPQAKAP